MTSQRNRGLLATHEGATLLEKRRRDKDLTLEEIGAQAGVSTDVVKRLLNPHKGKGTDRSYIEKIARVLDLEPIKFIDPDEWIPPVKSQKKPDTVMVDWQNVFLGRIEYQEKQRLFRQTATQQGFELNVFVPLGLVERKKQPHVQKTLQEPQQEAIAQYYEHNEFLQDVIGRGTGVRKVAIVGEPGAGKTTILSRVARYIRDYQTNSSIYVALAGLKGKSLENFILEEWLPEAMAIAYPDVNIGIEHRQQFERLLRKGEIWLLLDGVDEIANISSSQALAQVRSLPLSWQVRMVVTCRSNVWDSSLNNGMQEFETYRTLDFNPAQVADFIRGWFMQAGCIEYGEQLIAQLQEPQRRQIFQLVRNPLRLTLLCQLVYREPNAALPESKVVLYEKFVNYFYEWKPNITNVHWETSPGLKKTLHKALGRVALEGLDGEYKFRLPLGLIHREMEDDLFKLAWELGWLNLIDYDPNSDEPIYSFFHPNFQEYFAALAIDDGNYFLPSHAPKESLLTSLDEKYRIFNSNWMETFLFWISIQEIDTARKFIGKMLSFEDKIDSFQFFNIKIRLFSFKVIKELSDQDFWGIALEKLLIGLDDSPIWIKGSSVLEYESEIRHLIRKNSIYNSVSSDQSPRNIENSNDDKYLALYSKLSKCISEYNSNISRDPYALKIFSVLRRIENYDFKISSAKLKSKFTAILILCTETIPSPAWEVAVKILAKIEYELTLNFLRSQINYRCEDLSSQQFLALILAEVATEPKDIKYFRIFQDSICANSIEKSIFAIERLIRIAQDRKDEIESSNLVEALCVFSLKVGAFEFIGDDSSICENCFPAQLAVECLGRIGLSKPVVQNSLTQLFWEVPIASIRCEIVCTMTTLKFPIQGFWAELIDILNESEEWLIKCRIACLLFDLDVDVQNRDQIIIKLALDDDVELDAPEAEMLKETMIKYLAPDIIIRSLEPAFSLASQEDHPYCLNFCYEVLFELGELIDYSIFYELWHSDKMRDFALFVELFHRNLQQHLTSQSCTLHVMTIDAHQFINPENPTEDIYIEMLDQGCPETQHRRPTEFTHLKTYWRLDIKSLNKIPALIIYNSGKPSQALNRDFLKALSTFGGLICIITDQTQPNLQTFSPHQPDLVLNIIKWLDRSMLEA
jgi:GTPase SAR1 family protein